MKHFTIKKCIITIALAITSALFVVFGATYTQKNIITTRADEGETDSSKRLVLEDDSFSFTYIERNGVGYMDLSVSFFIGSYYQQSLDDKSGVSSGFSSIETLGYLIKTKDESVLKRSFSSSDFSTNSEPIGNFQCGEVGNVSYASLNEIGLYSDGEDPAQKYYYFYLIVTRRRIGNDYVFIEVAKSSNFICTSYAELAERQLQSEDTYSHKLNYFDKEKIRRLRKIAGYNYIDEQVSVLFKYRNTDVKDVADMYYESKDCSVDQSISLHKDSVIKAVMQIVDETQLSDFNVVRREVGYTVDGNSESAFLQDEYTLLEATGYDYVFHKEENYGELTVTYGNFAAKDFALTVRTNDTQHSVLYIRSGDIKTVGGKTTVTFDTSNIKTRLSNNFNWNVDNTDFNNYVINNPHEGAVTFTKNLSGSDVSSITVTTSDTNLLADCSLFLQLEVVPPVDLTITVKYTELSYENGEIGETTKTYQLPDTIFSTLYTKINKVAFFDGDSNIGIAAQGDFITEKIYITDDNGEQIERLTYNGVKCYASDNVTKTAMIEVLYTRNTLLRIYDTYLNEYRFIKWTSNSLNYDCGDFLEEHDGYRIKSVESDNSNYAKIITTSKPNDWQNAKVSVLCQLSAGNVIPITVTYSDKWKVTVEYLEDYYNKSENKNTGFAVKKSLSKEIKVKDADGKAAFADINSPTLEEVAAFLGKSANDLTVVRFGAPNLKETTVTCVNDEFTIKLAYGRAILKTIQADGSQDFIMIPLSNFADWVKGFGRDWSILVLNTNACIAFDSEFDVDPSDLYGYFYVAIFKEQVKNLDSLFAGYTADSCRSFFSCKKVVGNDVYKTCQSMGTLSTILCLGIKYVFRPEILHFRYYIVIA